MGLIGFPVCSCMFHVVSCNLSLWLCVTLYICNLHRAQWIMLRYAWHLPNRGSRLLSICTSNFLLKLCRQNEIYINLKGNISSYYNDVLNYLLSLKYFLTPLKEKCTLTMKTQVYRHRLHAEKTEAEKSISTVLQVLHEMEQFSLFFPSRWLYSHKLSILNLCQIFGTVAEGYINTKHLIESSQIWFNCFAWQFEYKSISARQLGKDVCFLSFASQWL